MINLLSIIFIVIMTLSTSAFAEVLPQRPFRSRMIKLDASLDAKKPLALSDGSGFVVSNDRFIGAINKEWLASFSILTGETAWFYHLPAPATSPPVLFGSSVVVGLRSGTLVKIEVTTGKKIWEQNLDSFTERAIILSSGTLIAVSTAQVVHALDFQSGKILWLYDAGFPEGLTVRAGAAPLIHDGQVIVGIASGEVLSISLTTGKLIWRQNPSYREARFHDVVGEMIVKDGALLLSRYDGLVASMNMAGMLRKGESGPSKKDENLWQDEITSITASTFRNGRYYVGCLNGDVYAYDSSNGRKVWRAMTGQSVFSITPSESQVYISGAKGRLTTLDTASGQIQWSDDLRADIATKPVALGDSMYFASGLKNLYGFKVK